MRDASRFIADEDIDHAAPWDFGAVDTAAINLARKLKERDEEIDRILAEVARQEGFDDGFKQGQEHAAAQAQKTINEFIQNQGNDAAKVFAALFESAQQQLNDAQQTIAQGVLELACELSRQILRQELSVNPHVLLPVIREALGLLIGESKGATVRLNPVDLDVLHDTLVSEFGALSLTFQPDPSIQRGGCFVDAAGTVIDGTLQKRWKRAVANLGLELSWNDTNHDE